MVSDNMTRRPTAVADAPRPGTVVAVQTRFLILAALITGLVILAAAAIRIVTLL